MNEKLVFEDQTDENSVDPDETPIKDRKLVAQPYDLVVHSLMEQIENKTLHLRPYSNRPRFQRHYIWDDKLASKLVESILLNVPIPPCYLSQNEDFELDVIDGQQRIFSVFRYLKNQFKLTGLEVLADLNDTQFYELPAREQRKILTHTMRCVMITNDSHPEIKFDVFERLNTNTAPLNSQELRNCVYRGALIDLLGELAEHNLWLMILGRKEPDKRMRGEELVLRFFAFHMLGVASYRTPQKLWLNLAAKQGQKFDAEKIEELRTLWQGTLERCLMMFDFEECFRRPHGGKRANVVNRALMDLVMHTASKLTADEAEQHRQTIRRAYYELLENDEFADLISKSLDHKSRTLRRFEIWQNSINI